MKVSKFKKDCIKGAIVLCGSVALIMSVVGCTEAKALTKDEIAMKRSYERHAVNESSNIFHQTHNMKDYMSDVNCNLRIPKGRNISGADCKVYTTAGDLFIDYVGKIPVAKEVMIHCETDDECGSLYPDVFPNYLDMSTNPPTQVNVYNTSRF